MVDSLIFNKKEWFSIFTVYVLIVFIFIELGV